MCAFVKHILVPIQIMSLVIIAVNFTTNMTASKDPSNYLRNDPRITFVNRTQIKNRRQKFRTYQVHKYEMRISDDRWCTRAVYAVKI